MAKPRKPSKGKKVRVHMDADDYRAEIERSYQRGRAAGQAEYRRQLAELLGIEKCRFSGGIPGNMAGIPWGGFYR